MLYHKDVYIPEGMRERIPLSFRVEYSQHSIKEAETDRKKFGLRILNLRRNLSFKENDIIEVETDSYSNIIKVVYREEYNSELFNNDRIKDNIRDYAFKEILSLILKNKGFENNSISLTIVDSCITKCSLYYSTPSDDTIERIRTDIVKAFKILGIFTGYEKDFGYKLIHIKDNTYRMNPFTKVETIKNILGSLSDFTNEKIPRENIELVLEIFNFSKIEK